MKQRGFTLTETVVACAIAAALLLVAIPAALGSKPAAGSSAALAVDAVIAKVQAIAATSGNGATLQFSPGRNGTTIRTYAGRPNGIAPMTQTAPDTQTSAAIAEASIGPAPFAVFFDSSGHASATGGTFDPSSALLSDPGCPAAGTVALTISDGRSIFTRDLSCAH